MLKKFNENVTYSIVESLASFDKIESIQERGAYMDIWILVIALLVIAIILFILSIYAKEESIDYDEHFREITNNQSQELQAIKARLAELENQYDTPTYTSSMEPIDSFPVYEEESTESAGELVTDFNDITDITRDHIIELYTQGYTMQEIAFEANVNVPVVQYVVDDYIENR